MRPERTKQLRSSIRLVPELVRASMVMQAFELEKLITATIDLSEGMEAAIRVLPQSYREQLIALYQKLLYKAFDAGYTNAQLKNQQFTPGTNALTFIRDRMPLPYSLEMSLIKSFMEDTAGFLKTVEGKEAIYEQFKRDVDRIYCEGATEYLQALPSQDAKEANVADKQDMIKEQPVAAAKEPSEDKKADSEKPKSGASTDEVIRKLEEYAKKAGTPEGVKVLRYYLGLPVQASVSPSQVVGSYDVQALRSKVLSLVQDHDFADSEEQILAVDSVSATSGPEVVNALGLAELMPEEFTLAEAKVAADELAAELTQNLDLPGTLVFAEVDKSLVLAFNFATKDFAQVVQAVKKVKSELPGGPMGTLDEKDKKELELLNGLDRGSLKMMTMKDLKKVAPKIVDLISEWITKTRNSEFKMGQLGTLFNMPMVDVVEKAYNRDGAEYFKHLAKTTQV